MNEKSIQAVSAEGVVTMRTTTTVTFQQLLDDRDVKQGLVKELIEIQKKDMAKAQDELDKAQALVNSATSVQAANQII